MLGRDDLHGYQSFASDFIVKHPYSAILLDCGCGKTVITLTAIEELLRDRFEVRKVMVICPIRVAQVWADEIAKWSHLHGLRYSIAVGSASERRYALNQEADIYIINRDVVPWLVEEYGGEWKWDMLVLDELSSFKNHQAKRFKAILAIRSLVRRVVGLTGTPSSNGLMDLWAEYRLLDLGERLGRFISRYRQEYFRPEKTNGQIVYSYAPLPGAEERIYQRISDITISMRCTDHLCMPELVSAPYEVTLSVDERRRYNAMKKEMVLSLKESEVTAANAASLSGKLTQMANGAVYSDSGEVAEIHSRKLDALEDLIEAQNGKPVLVAYWYKHDLKRIEQRLREMGVIFRRIDGEKANLILTDPPYNVNVEETAGKIMNDNMSDADFYNFLLAAYQCMRENLADDGSIYVWHADTEGLNFRKAFRDAGFYLSGCCIWKKNSLVLGRSPYQWVHEPCLFGWKKGGKHQWYSDRKQTTVWEYDKPKSSPDHPTMKPVALMSYPIKNSTMTNGIVLDPFLGSGSTLIACMETDRVCRGVELDPKFMDVIVKRYIAAMDGKYDDVYVIRDGQKLRFDEVAAFEPEVTA